MNEFDKWLAEVVEIKAARLRKDPHDVFQYVCMQNAKLSFIDGVSPEEFAEAVWN